MDKKKIIVVQYFMLSPLSMLKRVEVEEKSEMRISNLKEKLLSRLCGIGGGLQGYAGCRVTDHVHQNGQGMKILARLCRYAHRTAKFLLFFFIFSAFCSLPSTLFAEVPVKFTYQGNIRQSGFLVTGSRNMIFRIYDSSTAAVALWTSPASDIDVSTGVFKVNLEPVISDWESGNLWLELEIEGTILSPREEVTSSPYAINALLHSGKRYTTANTEPSSPNLGDLWMDTSINQIKYWNGSVWILTSGSIDTHADSHSGAGADPIVSLGAHSITGSISLDSGSEIRAGAGASSIFIATDTVIGGTLNPLSNLNISGAGYSVNISSSLNAGWFYGNGSGITDINASNIISGYLSGDRIGQVIVSSHVVDGSITRFKFDRSGCGDGQLLKWDNSVGEWSCAFDDTLAGGENDPLSIHISDTLQPDTTFYVSSGTVNNLTVNNNLDVFGTAKILGSPTSEGLYVNSAGNIGVGILNPSAKLEVRGNDSQNYSLAVGTSSAYNLVVSTNGNIGVGELNPQAKMEVTGGEDSGEYIMIFNSGAKIAAWLRNK